MDAISAPLLSLLLFTFLGVIEVLFLRMMGFNQLFSKLFSIGAFLLSFWMYLSVLINDPSTERGDYMALLIYTFTLTPLLLPFVIRDNR